MGPQLRCDLEEFSHHVQAADQARSTDAIEHLQTALDLVEGPPFGGAGTGYTWAHTEGLITHAIVAVDHAAHRLAQLALDTDNPDLSPGPPAEASPQPQPPKWCALGFAEAD